MVLERVYRSCGLEQQTIGRGVEHVTCSVARSLSHSPFHSIVSRRRVVVASANIVVRSSCRISLYRIISAYPPVVQPTEDIRCGQACRLGGLIITNTQYVCCSSHTTDRLYTGRANKKNNPLGKILYLWNCSRFFHQLQFTAFTDESPIQRSLKYCKKFITKR